MDWLLLISGIAYVLALHAEAKLKTARALITFDASLAPDWYFGGLYKNGLQIVSLFGGAGGAALLAYDWSYVMGWWSVAIFPTFLYLKFAIATRRSITLVRNAILAGRRPPLAPNEAQSSSGASMPEK